MDDYGSSDTDTSEDGCIEQNGATAVGTSPVKVNDPGQPGEEGRRLGRNNSLNRAGRYSRRRRSSYVLTFSRSGDTRNGVVLLTSIPEENDTKVSASPSIHSDEEGSVINADGPHLRPPETGFIRDPASSGNHVGLKTHKAIEMDIPRRRPTRWFANPNLTWNYYKRAAVPAVDPTPRKAIKRQTQIRPSISMMKQDFSRGATANGDPRTKRLQLPILRADGTRTHCTSTELGGDSAVLLLPLPLNGNGQTGRRVSSLGSLPGMVISTLSALRTIITAPSTTARRVKKQGRARFLEKVK